MNKSDFSFDLPEELIAQRPIEQRDRSRLLCLDRRTGERRHKSFFELPELLRRGDCLVLNDSRVLPARLLGNRETGGAVELLLLRDLGDGTWDCLARPGKKAKVGSKIVFGKGELTAVVAGVADGGNRLVKFQCDGSFGEKLERLGKMPLPPYIREELEDSERYQTVYSKRQGSAAAPTAGLHFTDGLLARLRASGVELCYLTLHVGVGTFRPVKADLVEDHKMHAEYFTIPEETAQTINRAKKSGGRVIAVGTTSCRALESCAERTNQETGFREQGTENHGGENHVSSSSIPSIPNSEFRIPNSPSPDTCPLPPEPFVAPCSGFTDIFIYPGYEFKIIDGLITNFHLPESTLIMLVSAFAGRENVLRAYEEAIGERYRFFSFGDAMLIS